MYGVAKHFAESFSIFCISGIASELVHRVSMNKMVKSTVTPIFSTFIPKHNPPPAVRTAPGNLRNAFTFSPQVVGQNASEAATVTHKSYQLPPSSAYVHLPFCRKRCHYCDFPIVALGSASKQTDNDPRVSNYIDLLCREINATKLERETNPPLETVFFGGGTPSLVPPRLVSSVLETLRLKFGLSEDAEISMEMDPGTFDTKKMEEMLELGVNRVSLGVQAFQQELLKSCGRAHGVEDVYDALDIVKSCGIENWSVDLISSLPHQTEDMWEESLRLTIEAQPSHVSVYDLQVEQGTKFGVLYTPGVFPLPSETESADYYRKASSMLTTTGYHHYEISSYCMNGYECKHNLAYWKNRHFYGFGLGSASHIGGFRLSRPRKLKDYTAYVQDLEDGFVNYTGNDHSSNKELALDLVMLSLRTATGLDLEYFRELFGNSTVYSICKAYRPYVESGHILCLDEQNRPMGVDEFDTTLLVDNDDETQGRLAYIRLSDPEGFLLSNELISVAFRVIDP